MTLKPQTAQPAEVLTTTSQKHRRSKRKKATAITKRTRPLTQPVVSGPNQVAIAVRHDLHTCRGGRAKNLYYRYQVWVGRKVLHSRHIPGGNVDKPLAIARSLQVKGWIKNDCQPHKILRQIEQWKRDDKKSEVKQLSLI